MVPSIEKFSDLDNILNPTDGEVIYVEEGDCYRIYSEEKNEWIEYDGKVNSDGNFEISLYEMNRQIISQLPSFNEDAWMGAEKIFEDYLEANDNNFYMFFGREIGYFTVFQKTENGEFENLFTALKACIETIGPVKSFEITGDKAAIEIWVEIEETVTCMYLFKYDEGIVTYNG